MGPEREQCPSSDGLLTGTAHLLMQISPAQALSRLLLFLEDPVATSLLL